MMTEEKLEELWQQLVEMDISAPEIKADLRRQAQLGNDDLIIVMFPDFDNHLFSCNILLKHVDGDYYPHSMKLQLKKIHPIHHIRYGSIDTYELEGRMLEIDWDADFTSGRFRKDCETNEGSAALKQHVHRIYSEIRTLADSGDVSAMAVAIQLQQRFWFDTRFGDQLSLPARAATLSASFRYFLDLSVIRPTIREAYHLMCFRPVCKSQETIPDGKKQFWYQLSIKDADDLRSPRLVTYPFLDLRQTIKQVPIESVRAASEETLLNMMRGEEIAIEDSHGRFFMVLDMELHGLKFYDAHKRPVSVEELVAIRQQAPTTQKSLPPDREQKHASRTAKTVRTMKKWNRKGPPGKSGH